MTTVLQISSSARHGGAGVAARRLHCGLLEAGVASRMLTMDAERYCDFPGVRGARSFRERLGVKIRKNLELHLPRLRYRRLRRSKELFSPGWFGGNLSSHLREMRPDIVHVHWTNHGQLSVEGLGQMPVPVVWTLHDMWPFTGGCHYSARCERFHRQCGQCPQLGSSSQGDLSARLLARKIRAWRECGFHLIAPSQWMKLQSRASALFRSNPVHVIPNGVDSEVFCPSDKRPLHMEFGLDPGKRYLAFVAMNAAADTRKGFRFAIEALRDVALHGQWTDRVGLLVIGCNQNSLPSDLPLPATALGVIRDEATMAKAYAMSDVFLAPSLEDNLPNTVLESLACGLPVVAFRVGGMPDMIEHQVNGYLADPLESSSLAEGIRWVLNQPDGGADLRSAARRTVQTRFSLERQVKAHIELYRSLISS